MRAFFGLVVLGAALAVQADAQSPADRLDAVAGELQGIVADLEASQAQATELRNRLTDLEALSADHQKALDEQARLLRDYQGAVAALEAHDRASLDLARDLRGQLETERKLNAWLWPVVTAREKNPVRMRKLDPRLIAQGERHFHDTRVQSARAPSGGRSSSSEPRPWSLAWRPPTSKAPSSSHNTSSPAEHSTAREFRGIGTQEEPTLCTRSHLKKLLKVRSV